MPEPLSAFLQAVAAAKKAREAARWALRQDERHNLIGEIEKRLKNQRGLKKVQVQGWKVDPDYQGLMFLLLEGDPDAVAHFRSWVDERLDDPEDEDLSKSDIVEFVVKAAEESVNPAMKSDRRAAHQDAQKLGKQIAAQERDTREEVVETREDLSTQIQGLPDEIGKQLEQQIEQAQARAEAAPRPQSPPTLVINQTINVTIGVVQIVQAATADTPTLEEASEALNALEAADAAGAELLRAELAAGGAAGVVRLINGNDARLREPTGGRWDAAGRIALRAGAFSTAEVAFERASRAPGASQDDAIRRRVRAASAALTRGEENRFDVLLTEARLLDAAHPAVRIAEARRSSDADYVLRHLQGVEGTTAGEIALLEATRTQAFLVRGEDDQAREHLARAQAADAESFPVRELTSAMALWFEKRRVVAGEEADGEVLSRAAAGFIALRDDLRVRYRFAESGLITARAIEALGLKGGLDNAAELLEGLLPEERESEASLALAESAIFARRADVALDLLSEVDERPAARLLRGDALTMDADPERQSQGLELLRPFLADPDDQYRGIAALGVLSLASAQPSFAWDEDAERILSEQRPDAIPILKGRWLLVNKKFDDAEGLVLPHAENDHALRLLIEIAVRREDWPKATARADELLARTAAASDRLGRADVLRLAGERDDSVAETLAVARDQTAPQEVRAAAFGKAVNAVSDRRDYTVLRDLGREWLRATPDDHAAVWTSMLALARLGEHVDALALYRESSPLVRDVQQAYLAGEVLLRAAPAEDAVREIAGLSEQFERSEEGLEAMVLLASARGGVELPEDLAERVREGYRTFQERFPNSRVMRTVKAPETPEEFDAFARDQLGEVLEARAEIGKQIETGEAGVFNLAQFGPSEIGSVWSRLQVLPLGFADPTLDELERADASNAVGGAAVWDASAIFVAGTLGATIEGKIRAALPGSLIAHVTLEQADTAASEVRSDGAERHEMGFDPEAGHGYVRTWTPEEVQEENARVERSLRLAKSLVVKPDFEDSNRAADQAQQDPEFPGFGVEFAAQISIAQRHGVVIYSDDRFVRVFARRHGLPAFGTLALLDVLANRGLIEPDERGEARRQLFVRRAWGTAASGEELVQLAREAGWDLSPEIVGVLFDRAAWANNSTAMWRTVVALLGAICEHAPDDLPIWTARVLDAASMAIPNRTRAHVVALLVVAWNPVLNEAGPVPPECFHRIIEAVKQLPVGYRQLDPVGDAVAAVMLAISAAPRDLRGQLFRHMLRDLPALDGARAMLRHVR